MTPEAARVAEGMTKPQARLLHYSKEPFVLDAAMTYPEDAGGAYKTGGLWVSVEGDQDWIEWCESENWNEERLQHVSEIHLAGDANVLRIASEGAIDAFNATYGVQRTAYDRNIDWPRVRREYDGLIIAPYQWGRRLASGFMWYYGWDCASGVIWNLRAIASVTDLGAHLRRNEESKNG